MEWEQYQARQKRKVEEREERERLEYAQVDWHDFIIVETINFTDTDIGIYASEGSFPDLVHSYMYIWSHSHTAVSDIL